MLIALADLHTISRLVSLVKMARLLVSKMGLGASAAAAALAAGGSLALCEADKRGPMFDPEALERGAKALKEINASPYAKKASVPSDGEY